MLSRTLSGNRAARVRRLYARTKSRFDALADGRSRNTFLAILDQGLVGCGNFITMLLVGRLGGSQQLGYLSLALTIYYLVLAVQESLITTPYTVYQSRYEGTRKSVYFSTVVSQQLIWASVALATSAAVAVVFMAAGLAGEIVRLGLCFALFIPCGLAREFCRRQLFAEMRVADVLRLTLLNLVGLMSLLGVVALADRMTASSALLVMATASVATWLLWLRLVGAPRMRRFKRIRLSFLRNCRIGKWLLVSHATGLAGRFAVPWIIAGFLGLSATGIFAACDVILRLMNPLIIGVVNILTPQAALAHTDGGAGELGRIVRKATFVLTLVMAGFCLIIAVSGKWILLASFGAEYAQYSATLLIVALSHLVEKIAMAQGRGLIVLERPDVAVRGEAVGFAINVVGALVLTPLWGILGAALALLLGRTASSTLIMWSFQKLVADSAVRIGERSEVGRS